MMDLAKANARLDRPIGATLPRRAALIAAILLAIALPQAARADDSLPAPSGPVILTVTGSITRTNAPGRAEFDQKMVEALGVEHLSTTTNWTDGKQAFDGVLVSKLLAAVGAKGTSVAAVALDDYAITIPISDFTEFPVILALRMNGQALTPRDRGPLWIVYPRDDYPALQNPNIDLRWVWQLKTLTVK